MPLRCSAALAAAAVLASPATAELVDGDLLIGDAATNTVSRVDTSTGILTPLNAPGALRLPQDVAISLDDEVLVLDLDGDVLRIDPATGAITTEVDLPLPISTFAVKDDGRYVVDQGLQLHEFDPATGTSTLLDSLAGFVAVATGEDGSVVGLRGDHKLKRIADTPPTGLVFDGSGLERTRDVAVGPDGAWYIASLSPPGILRVDPVTRQGDWVTGEVDGFPGRGFSHVGFDASGQLVVLAAGGWPGVVDVASGEQFLVVPLASGPPGFVLASGLASFGTVVPPGGEPGEPGSGVGGSQQNPFLPDLVLPGLFGFHDVPSGVWIDAPLTGDVSYRTTSDSLFTGVLDFPTGFAAPFQVEAAGDDLGRFEPGESVFFHLLPGTAGGVRSFAIRGVAPPANADDPAALPLRLGFSTPTASFVVTAGGCASEPAPACRSAQKASLTIRAGKGLKARWKRGDATERAALGAPSGTTGYRFCLWETTPGGADLLVEVPVPAGAGWREKRSSVAFKGPKNTPGVKKLSIEAGPGGKPKAKATLGGALLPPLPLPADSGLTFQIQSDTGECFGAHFTTLRRNTPKKLKAN